MRVFVVCLYTSIEVIFFFNFNFLLMNVKLISCLVISVFIWLCFRKAIYVQKLSSLLKLHATFIVRTQGKIQIDLHIFGDRTYSFLSKFHLSNAQRNPIHSY
jgi:hypothetical protein